MTQFPVDEAPGVSVFHKDDDGEIFHTYFQLRPRPRYADRHLSSPRSRAKGRDEDTLDFPMAWVRRRDEYSHE